jgi:tetratricopeptide (TPR) repeat protein
MLGAHSTVLLVLLAAATAMAPPAACAAAGAAAPREPWMQLERRIESSYFQQNAHGLQALAATLSRGEAAAHGNARDEEWRSYYAALLAYRLALLAKDDEMRAWPFTERCVDRLNQALVLDPGSAEALALQSACLAVQSRLDPWRSPLAAPLSLARIDKALKLAPDNPRVLLLGAEGAADRPRFFGGDDQEAFALLKRAVDAFEEQPRRAQGVPDWGAADAFTGLARDYLTRGDAIAARNVLERALLVAPDFGQARQLMAEIVSG